VNAWSPADVADALAEGLAALARELDAEQAVTGLDQWPELELHPALAAGATAAGFGVHREVRYPADRALASLARGERCDLVLTRDGRELMPEGRRATLFDPPDAVPLEEACWLEVKTAAQFVRGAPNPSWATQLGGPVRRDVAKLAADPELRETGLVLVLFTRETAVAAHDLMAFEDACLAERLPIGTPSRRILEITDRHGNGVVTVAVYPVGRR
jgi:hypothetical protein